MFRLLRSVAQPNVVRSVGCRSFSDYPAPVGPYSVSRLCGKTLYVSGCLPLDPNTGKVVRGGVEDEAEQVLKNIHGILRESGFKMTDVVKTTVLLTDMKHFEAVNNVYAHFFPEPFPARVCYAVKQLPKDVLVEIDAIAYAQ